jgi:hypothetical protein
VRIVIQAVPERTEFVEYMVRHLPNAEVAWGRPDTTPMRDFQASLEMVGDAPCMHFEDDVLLTKDFMAKALEVIGDGTFPVNFFHVSKSIYPEPLAPHIRNGERWIGNQGFYLPRGFARTLAAYVPVWPNWRKVPWEWWDYTIGDWLAQHRIGYWQAVPALVQHCPLSSTMGHNVFITNTFTDPEREGHPYPELIDLIVEQVERNLAGMKERQAYDRAQLEAWARSQAPVG